MTEPSQLSRRERQIMDVLYHMRTATTAQIREGLTDPPSGNAVRTLLQILEVKGHVKRKKLRGREYVFSPTVQRTRAGMRALEHVLETFYEGSIEKALTAHLSKKKELLSAEDFERLQQLIATARDNETETTNEAK
ncbi:MAG: BlaI/MecI/CopY family transcriptional regulator [Verrucomicrobiae bacterium]|nr:BlaI/MecI/CopY family transcriptional regulator [Verrucomicrobiae bacterium]